MKKQLRFALLALCLLCLGGCGKQISPREAASEAAPMRVEDVLPAFSPVERWDGGASYENVTAEALDAYTKQMEAKGFTHRHVGMCELYYTDTMILTLTVNGPEPGAYLAAWQTGRAVPDLDNVQSMTERKLLCAVNQTAEEITRKTDLRLLVCAEEVAGSSAAASDAAAGGCAMTAMLVGPCDCLPIEFASPLSQALWADLDGDGALELVVQTPGPTSGLYSLSFWAYGMEEGMPVLKATSTVCLNWGKDDRLEAQGDGIAFVHAEASYPLSIDGCRIVFSGEAPEDATLWGWSDFHCIGMRLSRVREEVAPLTVYDSSCCLIWRRTQSNGTVRAVAALSNNWETVCGMVGMERGSEGNRSVWRSDVALIETPQDLDALLGLSMEAVTEQLGTPHYDSGSGLYLPGWFTEDGLLLRLTAGSEVVSAELYDPLEDKVTAQAALPTAKASGDQIDVHCKIPSTVSNWERWEAFLERTGRGETDTVTLRVYYEEDSVYYDLTLAYDGAQYLLTDEGRTNSFQYLIVSEDEIPPAQARFRRAQHFLLSDSNAMTHTQWMAHVASSSIQPDFTPTRSLFTLYDWDGESK